jgi:hypothetical protein
MTMAEHFAMITKLAQVLKCRKNHVEVVASDPVLANFLKDEGDWRFLAKAPEASLREASGGNNTDWVVDGDVVTLTDQFASENECKIKLSVLVDAIKRLDEKERYNASW